MLSTKKDIADFASALDAQLHEGALNGSVWVAVPRIVWCVVHNRPDHSRAYYCDGSGTVNGQREACDLRPLYYSDSRELKE